MESVKPPPPFPQRLKKQKEEACYLKFILLKKVHINLSLVDIPQGVLKYAKNIIDIMENKNQLIEFGTVELIEE